MVPALNKMTGYKWNEFKLDLNEYIVNEIMTIYELIFK